MEDLVTYVLQRGHRKIAYIHGEDSSVTRSRLGSFYRTLQKKHIDVPDEYMPVIPYRDAEAAAMATSEPVLSLIHIYQHLQDVFPALH